MLVSSFLTIFALVVFLS